MSLRILKSVALVVGLPMTVQAEPSQSSSWLRYGETAADCSFSARLDFLSGYPFARLVIHEQGGSKVVPLAVREGHDCDYMIYSQVPDPTLPPTFQVSSAFLCMSRLPSYVVTRSLSGVQETCKIEE